MFFQHLIRIRTARRIEKCVHIQTKLTYVQAGANYIYIHICIDLKTKWRCMPAYIQHIDGIHM